MAQQAAAAVGCWSQALLDLGSQAGLTCSCFLVQSHQGVGLCRTPSASFEPAAVLTVTCASAVVVHAVAEHEPGTQRIFVALRLAALSVATVVRPGQRQVTQRTRQVRLSLCLVTLFLACRIRRELLQDRTGRRQRNFRTGQRAAPVTVVAGTHPTAEVVEYALALHVVPAVRTRRVA